MATEPETGGAANAGALGVGDGRFGSFPSGALLHLDESQAVAADGNQVDLAERGFFPYRQDAVAAQA